MLQQADVLRKHTNLRVSHYCGDMNVDYWDRRRWAKELDEQDIWVMTPQILLNVLRHGFLKVQASALSLFLTHLRLTQRQSDALCTPMLWQAGSLQSLCLQSSAEGINYLYRS